MNLVTSQSTPGASPAPLAGLSLAGPAGAGLPATRRTQLRLAGGALAGAIGAAVTASCGATAQPENKPSSRQVVEFMDWGNIQNTPTEVVINNFQQKFPTITVDVLPVPPGYEDKMRTMMAAGTPADIHRVNDDYVRGYTVKGQLLDLTPYITRSKLKPDDFFRSVYDFPIYQGKHWAWPVGNNPRLFFVNLTLFNNMGVKPPIFDTWDPPGWTWDDLIETAKKVTVGFDSPTPQFGVSIYDDTGFEETFLQTFGISDGIYSKDTNPQRWTMGTPEGINALQQVIDLTCRQQVQRPSDFKQSSDLLFQQGHLGIRFSTIGYANSLNSKVKDQFDWDVGPIPKKAKRISEGSLIVYLIPKEGKSHDGAWELLNYMGGEDAGQVYAEQRAFIPARVAAAQKYFRARAGEKPAHLNIAVEANKVAVNVHFAAGTERARQIYRPEFSKRAYTCQESLSVVADSVRKPVEDALQGNY